MNSITHGEAPPPDNPTVRATKALMALHAAVWVMFGIAAASPTSPTVLLSDTSWTAVFLMFANAAVLAYLAIAVRSERPRVFVLAVAVIVANLVLTLADPVGPADVFVLLLNALTLGLLFAARASLAARNRNA